MITIRLERTTDEAAREGLLDRAYGRSRFRKTSQRLRTGRAAAEGLSFVATERGRIVGTIRMWNVAAGGAPSLLLGPLAVCPDKRRLDIGGALMRRAIEEARRLGHGSIMLVGDAPYYGRFGFGTGPMKDVRMPGPHVPERLLGLELMPGALDGAQGLIAATGPKLPKPARRTAVANSVAHRAA